LEVLSHSQTSTSGASLAPLNWQQVRFANLWFHPWTPYLIAALNKKRQPVFIQQTFLWASAAHTPPHSFDVKKMGEEKRKGQAPLNLRPAC